MLFLDPETTLVHTITIVKSVKSTIVYAQTTVISLCFSNI